MSAANSVTLDVSATPRSINTKTNTPHPQNVRLSPGNVNKVNSPNEKNVGEHFAPLSLNAPSGSSNPSPYISVSSVSTGATPANKIEHDNYGDAQQLYLHQYNRIGGNNAPNSLPPAVLLERNPIVVPSPSPPGNHDVDPFVVTVRNSPSKLGKSNSASFIGKSPPAGNIALTLGNVPGGANPKTGPRLALYRSNSSLDLLDRDNYCHHRSSLGGAKLSQQFHQHTVHTHALQNQQQSGSNQLTHLMTHNHQHNRHSAKPEQNHYTGCFTRRKDFGSHGSIDMLSNNAGFTNSVTALKSERSGSLGSNSSNFLSLVASSMSRDRRGSFDVHEDNVASNSNTLSVPVVTTTVNGKKDVNISRDSASPRLRYKFQKLWEHKEKPGSASTVACTAAVVDGSAGSKGNMSASTSKTEASIFRKLRGGSTSSRNKGATKSLPESVKFDSLSAPMPNSIGDLSQQDTEGKPILRHGSCMEERYRRRVFAHYDCQSVSANISYAARLRGLLSKRRSTTTGASAASLSQRPISTINVSLKSGVDPGVSSNDNNPSLDIVPAEEPDTGDGNSNALVLNCPYFRNEVGGEAERVVCLTRLKKPNSSLSRHRRNYLHLTASGSNIGNLGTGAGDALISLSLGRSGGGSGNRVMIQSPYDETCHRSQQARGLSLLEWNTGTTHWLQGSCPYTNRVTRQSLLEAVDLGAAYYRKYFYRQEHENWFGSDEVLGPLAISVKRERADSASSPADSTKDISVNGNPRYMYRLIVRSTELNTLRGSILEESVPGIKPSNKGGTHAKDVIEFLLPEIQLSCLKLGLQTPNTEDQLLKLDQQILTHRHKVGIMYCKAGQATEEEMYNNEEAGPAFNEFLDLIGQRIRLKGFDKYTGGLDNKEHENWFGSDEVLGPLAISVKRERADSASSPADSTKDISVNGNPRYMYRLIVRSTELNTLRGSILEESVPGIKPSNKGGTHAKDVIEFLLPEIQLSCLKLGLQTPNTEDQLLKLDQQILTHRHKVGIMYCKAGQATEEEMYNNEEAGPAFNEFLDLIGQRIRLKGFDKYTGGLDNKDDSTGQYSVYSQYQDCEVIFHVSTLLPFTANNRQQLMRKRHIGNDIVTVVFQEPGALPFTPKNIRSQFQHVFIIVRALNPCSDSTCYSVSVSRSKEVPLFGPAIPEGAKFPRSKEFVDFLLAKVINAENATYRSEKFTTMATRTRQEYLKDLVSSYSTNTSIDPRPKFSIPFGNKKKELTKPKFNADAGIRGALSWSVYLDDNSMDSRLDAYLAISIDSVVIVDSASREPVFAVPCTSVLGWNTSMCNSLRIYYHQGECVTVHSKEPANTGENDELLEIVNRLEAVTRGCETQEFILRRNDIGQLGFHVQQDGVVTEVEPCGFAAKAGLKQGSRLVEICKVAVATLTQEQMIDFLKTSNTVVVMVVLPLPDGTPRRGCDAKHCIYATDVEGGYENLNLNGTTEVTEDEPSSFIHPQFKTADNTNANKVPQKQQQQPVSGGHGHHRKRYEPRSFSPPRSSNSSGYGTGSSSKSFSSASDPHFPPHHEGETLTSSSSGMSSADDRWYDLTENLETNGATTNGNGTNHSPPPIPARNVNNNISVHQSPAAPSKGRIITMSNDNNILNGVSNAYNNNNNDTTNNSNYMNNKNGQNVNGNLYITSPVVGSVNGTPKISSSGIPDKSFIAKREFFQRNNPHHGSFHSKLTPSRSHDALHLKNTYGLHHPQLRAFPSSATVGGGIDNYGAVSVASSPNGKMMLQRDHSSLGLGIMGGGGGSAFLSSSRIEGNTAYASPLLETTVKGKVTYLTDFPLTHSHSSEYLVGNGVINKDLNALKNERLAALKSAYLDKHRDRERERVEKAEAESNRSSRFYAPPDSISGEISCSEDDTSQTSQGMKPRSSSLTSRYSNSSSPKTLSGSEVKLRQTATPSSRVNRSSTLQEDLLKLINPDYVSTKELEATSNSTNNNSVSPVGLVHRPNSSGPFPVTNGHSNSLKVRPVSCGSDTSSSNYSTPSARAGLLSTAYGSSQSRRSAGTVGKVDVTEIVASTPIKDDVSHSSDMGWPSLDETAATKSLLQCCDIDANQNCSNSCISTPSSSSGKNVENQSTKSPHQHNQSVPLPSSSVATNSSGSASCSSLSNSSSPHSLLPWIDDLKVEDGDLPIENVFNLEARVSQLEAELRKEQQSKQVLAAKVANLQQENR